jgi:molecular chaperone DnaK (HSP70)
MNKFQQGKIYTIRSHQTDKIYIGSTIDGLSRRLSGHRNKYKIYLSDKKNNLASFEILKYPDYYIELLESFPCDNKNELHRREGELIRSMDCVNKMVPGRTVAEWLHDNPNYKKEYNQLNKLKIAQHKKEYNQLNKIEIIQYKKEYQQLNKLKIAENKKEYYFDNKLKIAEHRNKKCICVCGCKYTRSNKAQHKNSLKHIKNFIAC